MSELELAGTWRAAPADDELRRAWADPTFDDGEWEAVAVPGHWRSTLAFADADGPFLYRHEFDAPGPEPGERAWLVLDGLFSQGDIWLDGAYLGDTEGYFAPHEFEVTEPLRERSAHTLGIEVSCARPTDLKAKRTLTGVYQHGPFLDPAANPGGIWRPVRLRRTGPIAVRRLRVLCTEASPQRAVVAFDVVLDAPEATTVVTRTTIGEVEHRLAQPLAAGENRVRWNVTVEQPELWWPRALGAAPLHEVCVQFCTTEPPAEGPGGTAEESVPEIVSDERRLAIGLRTVALRNWVFSANGQRLFLKGANVGPVSATPASASIEEVERDVRLAVDAGLDLIRVTGHIAPPALYDAADRAGLLVWQDLPLQWGYHRSVRRQAVRQARQAVDLLGHHPSIVLWCGHNEPGGAAAPTAGEVPSTSFGRYLAGQELPGWNREVLDRSIRRALAGADPTRPAIAHSGVLPHPPSLDGTDLHSPFGWQRGHIDDLAGFARVLPRAVRFVGQFGAQAVPDTAGFCEPERWPELDWAALEQAHGLERALLDELVPAGESADFASWQAATQRYQAEVVRRHVETLRRLRFRPTGGFAAFFLSDSRPAISAALVDHAGRAKAGYEALTESCRPVIVVADLPFAPLHPGHLHVNVHAVSDRRTDLTGTTLTATVRAGDVEQITRWEGDIPADSCVLVGHLHVDVPDHVGAVTVHLALRGAGLAVDNHYTVRVRPSGPGLPGYDDAGVASHRSR